MSAALLLLPTVLSLLVFCAHLLRSGAMVLIPFVLLAMPLLIVRSGWVARIFQVLLTLAAFQWVLTAVFLARERAEAGLPWLRMALILGAVALFTFAAALLFEAPPLQRRYPRRFSL